MMFKLLCYLSAISYQGIEDDYNHLSVISTLCDIRFSGFCGNMRKDELNLSFEMDRDWMSANRLTVKYREGVDFFLEFSAKNADNPDLVHCPCLKCEGVAASISSWTLTCFEFCPKGNISPIPEDKP
ncbi:hypothetical protein G4B88_017064 [Cannabis sativa]|uniref:Transposase-associated domain-containing protein n=1 Tax=Cannabis sativa TaxID=3483 RepID=A0A7J6DWB0_CANSA|nr:hypothetical protein G4B88_017064 [Cannabis sativa]